jgi:uncharacterized protein
MNVNDLTAPLGQTTNKRPRSLKIPVSQIAAAAFDLFLGLFLLWVLVVHDPSGGEPVAVAPADLRVTAKPPAIISVPQAAESAERNAATVTTAAVPSAPKTVTVTIIDGKTGAKREVEVAAPAPANAADRTRLDPNNLR